MPYRIYPSIGIARAGNDLTQFYIGPEIPGHPGFDVDAAGNETRVEHYKVDEDQIKRQAARFRLFEDSGPGGAWREA
jgi:L-Lysine epsilon oxidase N-terminal